MRLQIEERKNMVNNTLPVDEYIESSVIINLIAIFWYKLTIFRRLPTMTMDRSVVVFIVLAVVCTFAGIVLSVGCARNMTSILDSILVIYGIWTILSYRDTFPAFLNIILCIAALTAAGVLSRLMLRLKNTDIRNKRIILETLNELIKTRRIIAAVCAVIISPFIVSFYRYHEISWLQNTSYTEQADSIWMIENNPDILYNLQEDVWEGLSNKEKADLLQSIANIETNYLGLTHELRVTVIKERDSLLGTYQDPTHTITVNKKYFDTMSAHAAVEIISHEAYHSYQHSLCKVYDSVDPAYTGLMLFSDVPYYQKEFRNYTNVDVDKDKYRGQLCERRAREYAAQRVEEYYSYCVDGSRIR